MKAEVLFQLVRPISFKFHISSLSFHPSSLNTSLIPQEGHSSGIPNCPAACNRRLVAGSIRLKPSARNILSMAVPVRPFQLGSGLGKGGSLAPFVRFTVALMVYSEAGFHLFQNRPSGGNVFSKRDPVRIFQIETGITRHEINLGIARDQRPKKVRQV
jgi:hypothetical protein